METESVGVYFVDDESHDGAHVCADELIETAQQSGQVAAEQRGEACGVV